MVPQSVEESRIKSRIYAFFESCGCDLNEVTGELACKYNTLRVKNGLKAFLRETLQSYKGMNVILVSLRHKGL